MELTSFLEWKTYDFPYLPDLSCFVANINL